MNTTLLVAYYLGGLVAAAAALILIDRWFFRATELLAGRPDQYRHRVGTELPRVPQS